MTDFYWDDDPEIRTRHLYLPGQTGTGKTSLMANLALDDIEFGEGPVIIIDPKGTEEGLVNRVIKHIPKTLIPSVFYISLRNPVPIEMMDYRSQFEKNMIKSDVVSILKRFSDGNNWGTTMQDTIVNLVPTLLEAPDATFLDIGRFLESKKRRDEILEQVSPERQDYWRENPPTPKETGPIKTRMSNFKEEPLRTIVSGRRGTGISVADIIENNQILLADTGPWSDDGLMLGALIMSRIQQAIFRRDPKRKYPVCTVYADEFHFFQTSRFDIMLTQARSFGLSLCLANQHPGQVKDIWDDVKGIWTYLLFRMDGEHAHMLRSKINEPPPPPPRLDMRFIKGRLAFLKEREKFLESLTGEMRQGWTFDEVREAEMKISEERLRIDALIEEQEESDARQRIKPRTFLDQIPSLPKGEAIFIHHSGETTRIKLVAPPIPPPFNYMDEIIEHTRAASATSSQKRSVDNETCDTQAIPHTEGNGSTDPRSEDIKPTRAPGPKTL
jgi:hypothetical protein